MASAFIGTSGWNYPRWKDDFYAGVRQKDWLRFCAERFTGIEANATFYRQQSKATLRKWRDETPDDFVFAVKGNRFLTHNKKLKGCAGPLRRERGRAEALEHKLGAVVWQLQSNLKKDLDRLRGFADDLESIWPARHALEFRNESWFDDEVAALLRERAIAVCMSDAADWPMWEEVTADFVYVRLHGHTRTYASAYSAGLLRKWAGRIRRWLKEGRDVHVYFDNDGEGAAPKDATRLLAMVR